MNIHPLVVHFPIALLCVYAVLEIMRRWTRAPFWVPLRATLLIIGTLGAFASLQTGEIAEHLYQDRSMHAVLEVHAFLASVTTWIFGILAVCYILRMPQVHALFTRLPKGLGIGMQKIERIAAGILSTALADILALTGFITLGLVGALGGILVYGPDFDPITTLVYRLFF